MAGATWFIIIASIAIAVYLGLAVHVLSRSPRRPISWVFSGFCLAVVGYYLSSLFLFSHPSQPPLKTPVTLRWKWVAISLSPALYVHLASFYFPPAWRQIKRWTLCLAYLIGAGFSLTALFTHRLVAGSLHRPPSHITGVVPGPLMVPLFVFFILSAAAGVTGLIVGYKTSPCSSSRRQILYLLAPTGLLLLTALVEWIIVLTEDAERIPHELGDVLVILSGFLYARAVLRYGSFVGRPTARRELFYSALGAILSLAGLYLTLTLDQRLSALTPIPYPLVTGVAVIIVSVSFPAFGPWIVSCLDKVLFRAESQQRAMVYHLVETLRQTPDPEELQSELLEVLCAALGIRGGYLATAEDDSSAETWTIRVVRGKLPVQSGEQVSRPPLRGAEPQLLGTLAPKMQAEPAWTEVALLCPLPGRSSSGFIALGEKRNGRPFTPHDISFCIELVKQIDRATEISHLREERNRYLKAAHLREQALQELQQHVVTSVSQALSIWEHPPVPPPDVPLQIWLLGTMQIIRNSEPVPDGAWGTEKAKALLAYLLWKGRSGATREEISAALWPGRSAEEATNVFHVTLHRLRRVLEPKCVQGRDSCYILYEGGRYRFNFDTHHWLDVKAFQALISNGEPAALREAISLYRGAYLEDVGWELPPEVEWERRAIERLYTDALRQLAAQSEGREAELYLEKLLVIEPADEATQHALVTGYLARGRRDLARRQIGRWRDALADLNIEPAPETRALWDRLENQS